MVGSMRSCVADGQTDRRTDGQTDGAGYIGPAEGYGGSKNTASIHHIYIFAYKIDSSVCVGVYVYWCVCLCGYVCMWV